LHIALLRGINVGGNKMVAMAALRGMCEKAGFDNPQTLLQSGNLVVECADLEGVALEQRLEREIEKRLKVQCSVMVRTVKEWDAIIARNPFPDAAKSDPSHLLVYCLKTQAVAGAEEALRAAITGPEQVVVDGRHAYIWYSTGVGTSKITPALIEKKLGAIATGRNWNTVQKLAALYLNPSFPPSRSPARVTPGLPAAPREPAPARDRARAPAARRDRPRRTPR
jgi:uncharacterized protein (DUF1697 family)